MEKSKIINVLNYNENPVCIKTHLKEYLCPAMEGNNPSITPLVFSEVESLNSNSPVFRNGILFFEKRIQEEVYSELRIIDWKDILNNKDIENILLHPTLDGLLKIVNIKSVMLFERVRGVFFSLKNSNQHDISTRVEKIVNTRYKELCNRKLKSNIVLTAKDTVEPVSTAEVNDLKKQNELLQEQMSNMQKMMEQMMSLQNNNISSEKVSEIMQTGTNTTGKKPGRPKKTQ